ncbi:MAG TPA: histidinol phosphate phosphatase, partial [Clostridia bacterium]|nr:histidinol phosphate phosphatase [Clostridia bacterium]
RYICGMHGIKINIEDYADRISAIYRELVRQNKALEINTSGLRQQFGTTMPDLWGLELYKKAGGEMITVGSDAHTAKDVGTGIMEGIALAKQAGFSDVYLFRDRKPVAQKI